MKVTEENIFLEHESLLETMGRVPTTSIRGCLKVSVMWSVNLRKAVILVTGLDQEGQMLATAVPDRQFGSLMDDLERSVERFQKPGEMVAWSIGRKETCPEHIKDRIHSYGAHRMIFLDMKDLPAWLADLNYRELVKKWRKEKLKVKFTRMMALDALEAIGAVMKR